MWILPGLIWLIGLTLWPVMACGQPAGEVRELQTVVIDPGHGGNDPGAVAAGIREKDLVLDVSLRLGRMISEAYPGVKVHYTRSKDVFIPLHARASAAVRHKADLFISVHANWVSQTSVGGTETFTLGLHRSQENLEVAKKENSVILLEEDYSTNYEGFNPNETESYIMFENMQSEYQSQSISLAAHIQEEFTRHLRLHNRGVKQAGFLVLRQITMPGVLVEIGFISNPTERKFLVSEEGKRKVAESLFKAFKTYKKEIDDRSRFTTVAGNTPVTGQEQPEPQETGLAVAATPPDSTPASGPSGKPEGKTPPAEKNSTSPGMTKTEPSPPQGKQVATNWYAVQIGAVTRNVPPTPSNFKGLKEIYQIRVAPYYKYFYGKFPTAGEAARELKRVSSKFPQAFVVLIENGVPRALKKSELP